MKLFFVITALIALTPHGANAIRYAQEMSVSREFAEIRDVSWVLDTEYRWKDDMLLYQHYEAGVSFPLEFLGAGWSGGTYHRIIRERKDVGDYQTEHRPQFDVIKSFSTENHSVIPALSWGLRHRYEYRSKESGDDSARFRIRLKTAPKQQYFSVKPYVAHEFFYDFDQEEWSRFRVEIGGDLPKFEDAVSPTVYFRLDTDRKDDAWRSPEGMIFIKAGF